MNSPTRAIYFNALESIDDVPEYAREWQDVCGADARPMLARQIRKDFVRWSGLPGDDDVLGALVRSGLRKVDWQAIAERILDRARTADAGQLDGEGEGESDADGEGGVPCR